MDDIREIIIKSVISALQELENITEEVIDTVHDVMVVQLNQYEIHERCTDLVVHDNASESALKKFIATKRIEGTADSTLQRYADENLRLIRFLQKPLFEITTYDIRFYLSYKRKEKKISNRTLDNMRRCYSSFFGWLFGEGLIGKNPCTGLSSIKYKKQVKRPFSAADMERLRKACENIRDLALLDFLYCSGCRVTEVSKLDISDIDFDRMECVVLGKGNKERVVYLSEVAAMHLQEYLESREDNEPALFLGKGSKRLSKNGIEARLKHLGTLAKVENVHPHRYRRTLATNLLDRGMNIQDVATILGHADLKTTQVYCYISQKNVQAAYQRFAS